MIRQPTPGAYLKMRRTAALLSVADVAARLPTDPAVPEYERLQQIKLIEADIQPATFSTIVALRSVYPFSLAALERLEQIAQGGDLAPPQLCRICAGSDHDALAWAPFGPRWWQEPDFCSACANAGSIAAAAAPDPAASPVEELSR